jgi:hypothetical protein
VRHPTPCRWWFAARRANVPWFQFVNKETGTDVRSVDDVEGVDDLVEAQQGGGLDEFGVGDRAVIEVSASIQEPAAGRGGLGVYLLQVPG